MVSPIYYFTKSGCVWCAKMQPSIEQITETLSDEQKIQILNVDDIKWSKEMQTCFDSKRDK